MALAKKAYGFRLVDRLARGDNQKLQRAMMKQTDKRLFFVEVYWDAKFINALAAAHKNKGYHIFKQESIPAALTVGLSLRRIIASILAPQLNIITHSLGALVASEVLFDADTGHVSTQSLSATPMQPHLKICMVAPAMGSGVFDRYFTRAGHTMQPQKDNYLLSVVYNRNDVILNKKLRVLFLIMNNTAADITPTTLGCDSDHDIDKLQLKIAPNAALPFDLSYRHKRTARKCHYLQHCYSRNHDRFRDVISYLEE